MNQNDFDQWLRVASECGELFDQDHVQTEKDGEIIIHTGMYEWADGTVHNKPDPDFMNYGTPQDDI